MTSDFLFRKQRAIQNAIEAGITQERRRLGLSQLTNSSVLGEAALSMSRSISAMENSDPDQISDEYRQRARSAGYQGANTVVAYHMGSSPTTYQPRCLHRTSCSNQHGGLPRGLWIWSIQGARQGWSLAFQHVRRLRDRLDRWKRPGHKLHQRGTGEAGRSTAGAELSPQANS